MSAPRPAETADEPWTLILRPHRAWLDLRLLELWRYRDLVALFVWRDFVATYKQTVLGPLWHIVQPILTTLTLTLVFGRIARLSTDGVPQFLFYLSGTVVWSYLAACVTKTASTFLSNEHIFGKVYFPRLAVPLATVLSGLVSFGIQLVLLLVVLAYFVVAGAPVRTSPAVLITPVVILGMASLGLGVGIGISALTSRYRDLQQLVTFGVQLGMYATPVIYPLSSVPERYRWLIRANPATAFVETFRTTLLGSGVLDLPLLGYSLAATAAILLSGLLLFNRVEATFMDTV